MKATYLEKDWQRSVVELAVTAGWTVQFHAPAQVKEGRWVTNSTSRGFPDLLLIRPPQLIVAELKVGHNKATIDQLEWLQRFKQCGVPAYLWYPEHWDDVQRTLLAPRQTPQE